MTAVSRMLRRLTLPAAAGAIALAVAAGPSPAVVRAPHPPPHVTFEATVTGVQTTEWKMHRQDPPGPCSLGWDGRGAERVEFASIKPTRIEVTRVDPLPILVEAPGGGPAEMTVRAKVIRHGHFKMWSSANHACGTGGDGAPPPSQKPSDCGKRTFDWYLRLDNSTTMSGLTLEEGDTAPLNYANCPVGNFGFPAVLGLNRYGRTIVGPLSVQRAFDHERTISTTGHGTMHFDGGSEKSYNTIEWTVTLRRVR